MDIDITCVLDDIVSPRSSCSRRGKALDILEKNLTSICFERHDSDQFREFLALQDTIGGNVSSRIMGWLAFQVQSLNDSLEGGSRGKQSSVASSESINQIMQCLSLAQGVALLHKASKEFLGSRFCVQIFLDLIIISRHHNSKPLSNSTNVAPGSATPSHLSDLPLASGALDTLLCVLVDAPAAVRAFEEANGVEVVVKLLKRAGIPRPIRMKCLEFLYFYLMDERSPTSDRRSTSETASEVPTRPTTPTNTSQSTLSGSTTLFMEDMVGRNGDVLSADITLPTSPPQTPKRPRKINLDRQTKSLVMLRKEVEFEPLSPKKLPPVRGTPTNAPRRPSPLGPSRSDGVLLGPERATSYARVTSETVLRTTDEKKEILSQLLGNVDTLVEGVKKAGIWGLS